MLIAALFVSTAAQAMSLELSATKEQALSILLQNAATAKIENNANISLADALAKVLVVSTGISGQCTYVGRSLIQNCAVVINEGTGGEGLGGKAHVFRFRIIGNNKQATNLTYEIAI